MRIIPSNIMDGNMWRIGKLDSPLEIKISGSVPYFFIHESGRGK